MPTFSSMRSRGRLAPGEAQRLPLEGGAPQRHFNPKPAATTVIILSSAESGQRLDASLAFGPAGKIDTGRASAVWDFGNGVSKSGMVVAHRFLAPGSHRVGVEIKLSNGSRVAGTRTLFIE